MQRRNWYLLVALTLFAFTIRFVWVIKITPNAASGDQQEYIDGAARLLGGEPLAQKNWMLFVRAPGYSVFIALVWKLVGSQSLAAVRVAQAVLSTLSCVYIYAMARLLSSRTLPAVIAFIAAAVYPYHIFFTSSPGTETLFAFFVASGMYHVAHGLDTPVRWRHLIFGGALFGLGNQVRPNLSTMLPLLAIWIVWRWRSSPRELARIAAALGVPILLVTLPWMISVHRQGFGWMWVTDGDGVWYFMGHNDQIYSLYCEEHSREQVKELIAFPRIDRFTVRPEYQEAKAAPQTEQQKVFWRTALAWDRTHLSSLPCLMIHKFIGYWRPWVNPNAYGRNQVLVSMAALPVLALGLLGLWLAWRGGGRPLTVLTLINVVTGTLVGVLFSTEIRYRVPLVDVLLLPFFGYALASLVRQAKR